MLSEDIYAVVIGYPPNWSCIVQFFNRHADVNAGRIWLLHWQAVSDNEQLASGTVTSRHESWISFISQRSVLYEDRAKYPTRCDIRDRPLLSSDRG